MDKAVTTTRSPHAAVPTGKQEISLLVEGPKPGHHEELGLMILCRQRRVDLKPVIPWSVSELLLLKALRVTRSLKRPVKTVMMFQIISLWQ